MSSKQYVRGMQEMRSHFGDAADNWIAAIGDIYPEFAKVNVEFPFAELYRRDIRDDKTSELCAVADLTVQGFALPELKVHVKGALNTGSSREEILEIVHSDDCLLRLSCRYECTAGRQGGFR